MWSPDGSQIAFFTEGDGRRSAGSIVRDQLVVNADGTGEPQDIDDLTYQSWAGGWYLLLLLRVKSSFHDRTQRFAAAYSR